MSAHHTQPLGVPPFHDVLPKYMSAFGNNIHAYLDELPVRSPSPAERAESSGHVSALILPFRDEDDTVHSRKDRDVSIDGIPVHLRDHDAFRTRMHLVHFRTLLMRCEVLQSTINALERKPWTDDTNQDNKSSQHYSTMRHVTIKARKSTEALGSRDLQARCEYWAGRGCGGLKDWEAAKTHFKNAIKLDVPNDNYDDGTVRTRGLLKHEKEDVAFLLQSVTKRHDEWLYKAETARKASLGSSDSHRAIENIDWEDVKGPSWTPDRDRMYELARKEFSKKSSGAKRRSRMLSIVSDEENPFDREEVAAVNSRLDIEDDRQAIRRVLSAEEWQYILHGDKETEKRQESGNRKSMNAYHAPPADRSRQHSKTSWASESVASEYTNKNNTPDLAKELEGKWSGSDGTQSRSPSPEQISRSPSPERTHSPQESLQQRGNLKLPPIDTSGVPIPKEEKGGDAG
jgi:hypothetical protein